MPNGNVALAGGGFKESSFELEDFLSYTAKRQIATLELISQILYFADRAAHRAFGRGTTGKDFDRVDRIQHFVNWGNHKGKAKGKDASDGKEACMSVGTQVIIRKDMESAGLLEVVTGLPGWVRGRGVRSPITTLANLDLKGLAQLARKLFAEIVFYQGFEEVDREHRWGRLASIVEKLTGFSLFTLDDDYTRDEAENERRKGERLLQAYAEADNWQWGGADYRSLVEDRLRGVFGPDWPDLLPF